ncbi:uncharacterized protein J3R85_003522 [Psidium guajava]|nr:uncharacterized protein J3R85_003522 [Psidium guajava]
MEALVSTLERQMNKLDTAQLGLQFSRESSRITSDRDVRHRN